nr:MAG TPA: hypothetical protein [Caudoviricetes sp.]
MRKDIGRHVDIRKRRIAQHVKRFSSSGSASRFDLLVQPCIIRANGTRLYQRETKADEGGRTQLDTGNVRKLTVVGS